MKQLLTLAALLLLMLGTAACGNKGPLKQPEAPQSAIRQPSVSS